MASVTDGIIFRRATLDDKSALFSFTREAYPRSWQYRIPYRWQWLYEDNPFVPGKDLPIWIATLEDGRIVAQTAALHEPLRIYGERHLIGWPANAITLPEFRNRGIGSALEELNARSQDISARLDMPRRMRRIMRELGASDIDGVSDYWRVRSCDHRYVNNAVTAWLPDAKPDHKILGNLLRLPGADRVVASILNLAANSCTARLSPLADSGLTILEIDRFGEEINSLWRRIGSEYDVIVERNALFCNWKFVDQPHMDHRRWFAWRGETPCGYIVLRCAQVDSWRIGIICDLFAESNDEATLLALLAEANSHFEKEGMVIIRASSSVATIGRCLKQAGFMRFGHKIPLIHTIARNKDTAIPGNWFLGRSDCDLDESPLREKGQVKLPHVN